MAIKISQFLSGGEMLITDYVAGLRNGNDYKFQLGTGIKDADGNYLFRYIPGAGTNTNYVQVTSAASTFAPSIDAQGGDADVNLNIGAKGTGHVAFTGTGAIAVPSGTTAQEPVGFLGGLRYNQDDGYLYYWDNLAMAWVPVIDGAALDNLTFVTNTDETAFAPNSQPLSLLASGFMFVTTGTGIVSSSTIPLDETLGGTGQTTYALGDTLYASAANTLAKLAGNITTTKQYLSQTGTGAVSAAPAWATISGTDITGAALSVANDTNITLTLGGTPLTALLRAASITAGWTGVLAEGRGGTGQSTYATGDMLYASAANTLSKLATVNSAAMVTSSTGVPSWSSTMTNGQVIIGSTGGTPVAANLTQGSGVTITNGAGTITISATGSGGTVTSVSGTANRIAISGTATDPIVDIAATYVGQASITTVGALASGSLAAGFTPVTVPLGGTGNTTFTAFSVLCAGTTATGTFQNVSGVGSAGQVLTSNGAAALPTWQAAAGGAAAASQADMEAASSTAVYSSPGRQQYHPGHPKAWVAFDASSTSPVIGTSYQVTSITDDGVGTFTVNFTVTFTSSAPCCVIGAGNLSSGGRVCTTIITETATTCQFETWQASVTQGNRDGQYNNVVAWGDL